MSEKGVKKIGGFIPEIPTRTLSRFPLLQIQLQLIIFILIQNAGSCFVVLVVGFFVCLFDLCFFEGAFVLFEMLGTSLRTTAMSNRVGARVVSSSSSSSAQRSGAASQGLHCSSAAVGQAGKALSTSEI